MVATHARAPRRGIGGGPLNEIDRLEAPDRSFVGHRDILTRSLARYHFVAPHARGALLDVGCGRGYGFEVLRGRTTRQAGVDISLDFLREAARGYRSVALAQSSGERLPFRAASFDTVVSFEVIEHLHDDRGFLTELRRLLRPGGTIAVSTPNRLVASGGWETPLNPFHVREYLAAEFAELLSSVFTTVALFGQRETVGERSSRSGLVDRIPIGWKYLLPSHVQGVLSVALRPPLQLGDCVFTQDGLDDAHTFVAICSG